MKNRLPITRRDFLNSVSLGIAYVDAAISQADRAVNELLNKA